MSESNQTASRVHAGNDAASNTLWRSIKLRRNDLCPCGSGKKVKHCCGVHLEYNYDRFRPKVVDEHLLGKKPDWMFAMGETAMTNIHLPEHHKRGKMVTISARGYAANNVEEFMSWGDMDEHGHPISRDKGRNFMAWVNHVRDYGYHFDHRILNAADFGAYTSRKRFFAIFGKKGLPVVFPVATYSKNGNEGLEIFGDTMYHKWKPVREVLDLEDEGESIFNRRKPLCEKTLERIFAGLVKFVAGGKEAFLVKYNSMNKSNKYVAPGIDDPCPTVACQNRLGLAKVQFLSKHFSGDPDSKNIGIDQPSGTVTCKDHHAFITAYYSNGDNCTSIDRPSPTIPAQDRVALVITQFYQNEYGAGGQLSSLDQPNPAMMTIPKQKLVSVKQYLMNSQFQSAGGSIDQPCFTLIARMDKMPPYLVTTKEGIGIAIFEDDSPMTCRIKEFMALYEIVDIRMRMLKVDELKRIMGFPSDYVLIGTQSEQKKFIGNAVEVNMAKALVETLAKCIRA